MRKVHINCSHANYGIIITTHQAKSFLTKSTEIAKHLHWLRNSNGNQLMLINF
jgi:hypothetical protein